MRPTILATISMLVALISVPAHSDSSKFDGTYEPSIESRSSDMACQGLVWERFSINNGKLAGGLTHSQGGFFSLSGSVSEDGALKRARASGSFTSAQLEGKLLGTEGSGTWKTTDGQCSGTWSVKRQ